MCFAEIIGSETSPYAGGMFKLQITVPNRSINLAGIYRLYLEMSVINIQIVTGIEVNKVR